ncbi:MAG: hypothetical protein K2N23_01095 [Clostridia bacterium]|nr:hypothetical protein [Clostridia bacterium]
MAVLAPVLERKLNTAENVTTEESRDVNMSAEERHNSRIKVNYAKLINPDTTVGDVIRREPAPQQRIVEPVREQKPFLVENARANSELFRADSAINRKQVEVNAQAEEEENEDLRPTAETIKYKSDVASKLVIDDKISNKQTKASKLSKRDKVIIAVSLLVIVALFVLVIINSAVLSNLNSEISYLESDLASVQDTYAEVVQDKTAYLDEENIMHVVSEFADKLGMIKK